MTSIPWYSEATLVLDGNLLRAGTLIQCVRKWDGINAQEQAKAELRLGVEVDGLRTLNAGQIAGLMSCAGFLTA